MSLLRILKGPNEGTTIELAGERIVLGRNADCGVVLNVPAVSREHAIIRKIQGKYYIEDNKSRNGTFLNSKEVTTRTPLKDNDRIKICDNVLAFFEKPPQTPLPADWRPDDDLEGDAEDSSTVQATLNQTSKQILEAQPAQRLAMLLDMGAELTQTLDLELLLPKIIDRLFAVFHQADRGFIILSEEGKLIPKVTKTRRNDDEGTRFSRSIVNRCIETRQSILSEDASAGKGVDLSQSIADCRIRSMMCVPLIGRSSEAPFGVIQLDTQDRFKQFTQDDLKLLLAVAGQAAIALENANLHSTIVQRAGLERDLQLARKVQESFLPLKMPQVAGYQFAAHYESAQEVGGDYYDFIPLPGGRHGVMVGDVAGKGIPAALLMAKVSADARFCALTETDLGAMIARLNEHLQEAGRLDRFVTFAGALLEPAKHQVTFVNAGHIVPLIFRKATGKIEDGCTSDQTGLPLGIVDGIPYDCSSVQLEAGDCVLFITDGITESKDRDERDFHMNGVVAAVRAGPMLPRALVDRLIAAVHKHAAGRKPHDDLTIVAFGRTGPDPAAPA
jgi:serine phosphatase RsbU (regulator of sigma subunit)/pSer/pThr/pTyr-binding forkhead associated (FHA) protein